MIRILLTVVLPLLAPTVLYLGYRWLTLRRTGATGQDNTSQDNTGQDNTGQGTAKGLIDRAPWLVLGGVGLVLMAAVLLLVAEFERNPPGSQYVPTQLIDGELQPGRFE